jgi:hypothetical protein
MASAEPDRIPAAWRRNLRSIEAAAVAGLIHAALLTAAIALVQTQPSLDASDETLLAYYGDPAAQGRMLLAVNLAPISVIAFLWFIAVIRRRIGAAEDKLFATVFLGSGLVFSTVLLVGFAAAAGPATSTNATGSVPGADVIRLSGSMGSVVLSVHAPRLAAVFVLATSRLGARTGALPRWLTVTGTLIGIAMIFMFKAWAPTPYLFPAWVALVAIALLARRHGGSLREGSSPAPDEP